MPYIVLSYYCGDGDDDNTVVRCETWKDVKKALKNSERVVRWIVENVENLSTWSVIDINEGQLVDSDVYAHYIIVNLLQTTGRRRTFNKVPAGYTEDSDDEKPRKSKSKDEDSDDEKPKKKSSPSKKSKDEDSD